MTDKSGVFRVGTRHLHVVKDVRTCTCTTEDIEPHACPYNDEIHPECEDLCDCCDECTRQCAMDI